MLLFRLLKKIDKVRNNDDEIIAYYHEGLKIRLKDNTSVLDLAELYFTNEIKILFVNETNWYAQLFYEKIMKKLKTLDTDVLEIMRFFLISLF